MIMLELGSKSSFSASQKTTNTQLFFIVEMSTLAVDGRKVFSHHHTFSFSLMILLLLGPYTTILFFINAELKSWPGGVSGAPIAFFHIVERLVV